MSIPDFYSLMEETESPSEVPDFYSLMQPEKQDSEKFFKTEEKVPSQFKPKEFLEESLRIPALAGLHIMQGMLYPYELAAQATHQAYEHPAVKASVIKRNALDEMELLQEFNSGKNFKNWSEKDRDDYDYYKRVVEAPSEETQDLFAPAPDFSIQNAAKTIIGFDPTPRNTFEKFTSLLSDIYGASRGNIKATAGAAPLASASVVGEETFGVPAWASLPVLAGVYQIGKSSWNLAKKGANWMSKRFLLLDPKDIHKDMNIKSAQSSMREQAEKQFAEGILSAKDYEALQPFFKTAEEFGIIVDPVSLSKSKRFKRIQKYLSKSDITEEQKTKFVQKATESWADSYLRATENIRKNAIYEDENSLIESLSTNVTQKKHKILKDKYNSLYEKSEEALSNAEPISQESTKRIEKSLDDVISKTSGSLFETAPEKETKGIATAAKEKLRAQPGEVGKGELERLQFETGEVVAEEIESQAAQEFQRSPGQRSKMRLQAAKETAKNVKKLAKQKALDTVRKIFGKDADLVDGKIVFRKPIKASQLVKSIRSLNNTLDWENPNVINLLSGVRKTLIDILETEYGKSHPRALFDLKNANSVYGKSQKLFGEDSLWKKWGVQRTEKPLPEELSKTLNSVSRFKQFEADFGKTPEGKDLIDTLKLLKVRQKLEPIFVKEYTPGSISSGLLKLERDPMFKYLASPETKSNLSRLSSLDKRIQQRSSSFYRNSDHPEPAEFVSEVFSIINPKMWAFKFANKLRKDQIADAYSYIMMNPDITKKMVKIGEKALKMSSEGHIPKSSLDKVRAEIMNEWDNIIDEVKTVSEASMAGIH